MTLIREDRIAETSTSTGIGAMTLAGALTAHKAFSAVMTSPSDTCFYAIEAVDGGGAVTGDWETGLGTYSAANTLTRTNVIRSSNSNLAVSFAAGTKRVFMTMISAARTVPGSFKGAWGAPQSAGGTFTFGTVGSFTQPAAWTSSIAMEVVADADSGIGTSNALTFTPSAGLGNNANVTLTIPFTTTVTGNLIVRFQTQGEFGYDGTTLNLDGVDVVSRKVVDTTYYEYLVSCAIGSHTLIIKYTSDNGITSGYQNTRISKITIPSSNTGAGYVYGDTVTYDGRRWMCIIDGALDTPVYGATGWTGVDSPRHRSVLLGNMRPLTDFSQNNLSGNRNVVETAGKALTVTETSPDTTLRWVGLTRNMPASPARVAMFVQPNMGLSRLFQSVSWGFSDGTKFEVLCLHSNGIEYQTWANSLSRNSTGPITGASGNPVYMTLGLWLGLRYDTTAAKIYWEISADGVNFATVHTSGISGGYLGTGNYTKAAMGMFVYDNGSSSGTDYPCSMSILDWDEAGLSRSFG